MKTPNRVDSHKPKPATVNPDPVLTPDEATDHTSLALRPQR